MPALFSGKKKQAVLSIKPGQMPSKTSVNLATAGIKKVNYRLAVPLVIILLAAAVLFSKFLVIDRLAEVAEAQDGVRAIQTRLAADYEELAGYDELNDRYAHYTYSGFTEEELARMQRADVLKLIRTSVLPNASLASWNLTGNELSLNLVSSSLQKINLLTQSLQSDPRVSYCTVSTANTGKPQTFDIDTEGVSAQVLVYLNPVTE